MAEHNWNALKDGPFEQRREFARFAFIHFCVRNDDHCPICRRYYVSFHPSWESAYGAAIAKINRNGDNEDACKEIKESSSCWVDEWVRRSNGDLYLICPVDINTKWDFSDRFSFRTRSTQLQEGPQFFALYVHIIPDEWCPDNINFYVSLFDTLEKASAYLVDTYNDKTEDNGRSASSENESPDKSLDIKSLEALQPLCLQSKSHDSSVHDYHHLQIIPIVLGESFELNMYCSLIQPNEWKKLKSRC